MAPPTRFHRRSGCMNGRSGFKDATSIEEAVEADQQIRRRRARERADEREAENRAKLSL